MPVAHALDAFLQHAPEVPWPPLPLIDEGEVTRLLTRCPASAPGPDGVHYSHLAAAGAPVARHLATIANLWLEHGIWQEDFKHSYLAPIPKVKAEEPWTPSATRPISLANTSGKILQVMRLLANSLYASLSDVVVRTQYGFLPGRQIAECIMKPEATCIECAPTHPGAAAIFLDVRKAFDSLDLEFLFRLLETTHAPGWMARALRACYTGTSVSFLVNGVAGHSMQTLKGLRQGCPVSAILFVFCMDPLLRWLERAMTPAPAVFGYADDLALVLIDVYGHQGECLSRFVELLPQATAMHINFRKTVVMPLHREGVGSSLAALSRYLHEWSLASEELRVCYLGVWVGHDDYLLRFRSIIMKMEDRVEAGYASCVGLSQACCLVCSASHT